MAETPGVPEPTLEEQIAAYQREFQDLDPQVEQIVSALSRLNRRMNVAYGRQTADLGISFDPPPDYAGIAAAAGGAHAEIMRKPQEVAPALERALRAVREERRCAVVDAWLPR